MYNEKAMGIRDTHTGKTGSERTGIMHLAPRGERIMALLSVAGWVAFFVRFAII